MKPIALLAFLAMTSLAGSVTAGISRDAQRLALVSQYAAEPVRTVHVAHARSWESLGSEHLLLWSTPRRAFLLKLDGFCTDLSMTFDISLKYQSPVLSAGFDRVLVHDKGFGRHQECRILEIRPVDVKAMKAAERAARKSAKAS